MPLFKLPNEAIIQIIEAVQDLPTLLSNTLTCKILKIIAEPCLYSSVLFLDGTRVRLLEEALTSDPKRRNYVNNLELRYSTRKFGTDTAATIDLCSLTNLKLFVSESPFCNSHNWHTQETSWIREMQSYIKCFEQASLLGSPMGLQRPLNRLRSITLHWTATASVRYWRATVACPIFLLPELEALEISCVNIGQPNRAGGETDTSEKLHSFNRQTNLKSLTITESNISATALKSILSLPKALQSLSYCETIYHMSNPSDVFATGDMNTLNDALAQQSESLTHLNIIAAALRVRVLSLKLSDFKALVSLRLGSFIEQTVISWTLSHPIPPALEVLQLIEASHHRPDDLFLAVKIDSFLASAVKRSAPFTLDLIGQPVSKKYYYNFSERFNKRLIALLGPSDARSMLSDPSLSLQFTHIHRRGSIPPYLYGEQKPLETRLLINPT